ncbi:UDP-3-O-(3-hydroxymyristoyl) glucosamine N-acyltransferase [Acinetobacter schindleri]|uniref:UDP-3-O-(3-hydroxymyristoyl)glucosamine N-acyltransferase n=1 Tax=Acinetobacter schindleri TaxID=108981 RepID=UPI00235E71AA|nr:UDP-3-O-(3-hydroxymyristoyl)glucosamine N-acyltransferase [Acinetobacter schindleri]WDE16074.1 UDP-3-O-(3-hydroxymyristoyl) glucosamine N-acyltransferase [Acinetobacter schindleri]
MKITNDVVLQATHQLFQNMFDYDDVGLLVTTSENNLLSFIEDLKYVAQLNNNNSIKGIFCTQEIASSGLIRKNIDLIIVDEPKWFFFSIVDYLAKSQERESTIIDPSSEISSQAYISPVGVKIGKNCKIDPNVTILSDVIIGDNVIIRAGSVLGTDGFEHKKTSRGILSVAHNGEVIIHDNVEIGANSHVAKGFSYRPTIIGESTKLDAFVHYAHGVQCGKECLIVAHAMIGGNVDIGNKVWIGPSAVITNRIVLEDNCFITLGSVVTRSVKQGETVTGNFAIPHQKFLKNFKRSLSND